MLDLWIKALHVIAVISWMAGLLYLPRLFVYHAVQERGSASSEMLKTMERRLFKFIMIPAMTAVWITGLWMAYSGELWRDYWFLTKFLLVLGMTVTHEFLGAEQRRFASDGVRKSQKFYRFINEAPTLLMICIVFLVIVKPF